MSIVIDDTPIGTPTLYDVPLLTVWEVETLRKEFSNSDPCFCLPTNSRSLTAGEAHTLVHNLACNLRTAAGARLCFPPDVMPQQ
jgi:hypothetical protein